MTDQWTCFHTSQGNSKGEGQGDLPKLLRTFADTVERLGDIEVLDLTLDDEITAEGSWFSLTLYYSRGDEQAVARTSGCALGPRVPADS